MEIILDHTHIRDCLDDIANQILHASPDLKQLALIGILDHGKPLASRLKRLIQDKTGINVPVGNLDVSLYSDDLYKKEFVTIQETDIPFDITDKHIILVDDIIFRGRNTRAALNGLVDFGRPSCIELAILIDRGHRKLPIFANYVGKTINANPEDTLSIQLMEIDGEDKITLSSV